jgi:hypothetical protein
MLTWKNSNLFIPRDLDIDTALSRYDIIHNLLTLLMVLIQSFKTH